MRKQFITLIMLSAVITSGLSAKAQQPVQHAFEIVKPVKQKLETLPFGEIKPLGWIKTQMQQDMDGFVGHLDELVPDLMDDKIYGADRLTKAHKSKNLGNIGPELDPQYLWWNSETQSNWRDGFIRNAILLNDTAYLAKAEDYINYILSTQDQDGYLGIYSNDLRYSFADENGELWAKTTVLRGMLAWYDYSHKPEILEAVRKATDNVIKNYPAGKSSPFRSAKPFAGGLTHGLVFTDILDHLFRITGNKTYMEYALFLYRDFSENILNEDAQFPKIMNPDYKLKEHGVHTYEHLRSLTLAYYASGNPELKKALSIYLNRIGECTTPSGGPIGDEWVGGRSADATHTGYEYCSLHELMDGYLNLFQKSGDASFGDLAERLYFNAAQGARLREKSAIAYCKTDNSYEMTGTRNGETREPGNQTRYKYSPAHQDVAVCCVPNAGRISPYFVKSMWMKDNDGLVATLAGPCEVETSIKNHKVSVVEETEYPFSNSVNFKVTVEKPLTFTLRIRKPEWAVSFDLNCSYTTEDGYIIITKKWKNTETIHLVYYTEPVLKKDRNNENYFTYGPLVFALPVDSKEIITKTYTVKGLNDYEFEPVNLSKYRISVTQKPEIYINHPQSDGNVWNSVQLKTSLVNESTGDLNTVSLLPLGASILRQETFPDQVHTSGGSVKRFPGFASEFVSPRNIDVWLPDGYDADKKYAVLYMHDGQMLYDSTTNWNHQEWGIDETIGKLLRENKIEDCIVVGIFNTSKRHCEYFPEKALDFLSPAEKTKVLNTTIGPEKIRLLQDGPISDNYLKFLISELKPFIDSCFSTLKDQPHTFIAGSSMGGLISMYAICEYPQVFGGAACLSTHWPGLFTMDDNPVPEALINYLKNNLPDPANHKIYFDYGDQTLDSMYPPLQKKADEVMTEKGYTAKNWITQFFPGKDHSERSWSERLDIPLLFLLRKQ